MKRQLLLLMTAPLLCTVSTAQDRVPDTPKSVIETYLEMVSEGRLLTDDGWRKADKLFLRPSPPPTDSSIIVVMDKGTVNESWIKSDRAEETVIGYDVIGRIDSLFRFVRAPRPKAFETEIVYRLVFTDARDEGQQPTNSKANKVWRIENPAGTRWTTLTAAIQYLTQQKKEANTPSTIKRLDNTLSTLQNLKKKVSSP